MKVLLVDDERIALDHMRHLLDWGRCGYEIAGTATNGRSALRLCEELDPHIMIVDIRMPVMDGLELIREAARLGLGAKCIIMSAHEDFEYARQALASGNVSGYMLKHEADSEPLIAELHKAREAWLSDAAARRLDRSARLRETLAGHPHALADPCGLKPPIAIALIQRDLPFSPVPSGDEESGPALSWSEYAFPCADAHPVWKLAGAFEWNRAQLIAVFDQQRRPAAMPKRESFRELASDMQKAAARQFGHGCSVYYSFAGDEPSGLADALRRAETAARHAVFCGREALVDADGTPAAAAGSGAAPAFRGTRAGHPAEMARLSDAFRRSELRDIVSVINSLFETIALEWNLPLLYETVQFIAGRIAAKRAALGLPEQDLFSREETPVYQVNDIRDRLATRIVEIEALQEVKPPLSPKLQKAIRYMQEHYHEDLNIEDVAYALGISASYLHQLFKRETRRTFLDVLTELRIERAKRILALEDAKVNDVCARVGYRSPQHFSQVFKKTTGLLPREFRESERA